MISMDNLYIVNYCHKNCIPLKNIMRLPEEEAFKVAGELALNNPDTTAFYRFADFKNYYTLRKEQDNFLYNKFKAIGGKPKEKHPLSFVLHGSEFLNNWFDKGTKISFLLKDIPEEYVSFTLGDSGATYKRTGTVTMYTKEKLYDELRNYPGTMDAYMKEIEDKYYYIEVQLWDDSYCIVK